MGLASIRHSGMVIAHQIEIESQVQGILNGETQNIGA